MTFCYTSGILLIVTNVRTAYAIYSNNKYCFGVSREIHQIFPVAALFFLLTNCWQLATDVIVYDFTWKVRIIGKVRA